MIDVRVNIDGFLADLHTVHTDQIPFAESLMLNTVTSRARDAMRALVPQEFTIAPQRVAFLQSLIRFPRSAWATKTKLYTTMGVHQSDGDVGVGSDTDRGFLLGRHEDGGLRTRTDPLRPFFIPTDEIRGGAYAEAPRSLYPVALGLMEGRGIVSYTTVVNPKTGKTRKKAVIGNRLIKSHLTASGKIQIQGKQGTFLVGPMNSTTPKNWGIYQRTGPGRRDVRLIWAFRTEIDLPPRLHFYETIQRFVDEHAAEEWEQAWARAIATAR